MECSLVLKYLVGLSGAQQNTDINTGQEFKEKNQFINVNRGFGFLAYPGRVGIYPEISLLELHSKNQHN